MNKKALFFSLALVVSVVSLTNAQPLKVFILAGQSNMVGQGEMTPITTQGTLEYIVENEPLVFGHLKNGGNWVVRNDVWIWYNNNGSPKMGGLTTGYGGNNSNIGPELQFGHVIGDYFGTQVLIIKTAWGGKSLAVDFRPPSSGGTVGPYYTLMLDMVDDVLTNLSTYFPAYNPADGYEIVGFGWHQGWNDRVNQIYNDEYEFNMQNIIKDVRNALGVSNMPFVIATTGMTGWNETHPRALSLMAAQLAMEDFVKYPEFEGNVAVDDTRDYWIDPSLSPVPSGNQAYHWNRNSKIYCNIGNGMALEMTQILVDPNAPEVDAGKDIITWSGEPLALDPNLVGKPGSTWTNLTYQWTADPSAGVQFSNDQILAPAVTINDSTSNPTAIKLILAVNNSGRTEPPVTDSLTVYVYDDSCKAARLGLSLGADNPTDIAGQDCITNIEDFADIALNWLKSNSLPAPEKK